MDWLLNFGVERGAKIGLTPRVTANQRCWL